VRIECAALTSGDAQVSQLLNNVILRPDPLRSGGLYDYSGKQWPW